MFTAIALPHPQTQLHENVITNLKPLPDLCTEKDLSLLSEKAQRLCQEKNTHVRFEKKQFSREKQVSANATHKENRFKQ